MILIFLDAECAMEVPAADVFQEGEHTNNSVEITNPVKINLIFLAAA